jgi:hypothetical protein
MNWKKYITDPATSRPKRGAISRIAALLGTHYGNVRRMFDGVWKPTADEASRLRCIVADKMDLAPKKRSDAGKKRGQYRKRTVRFASAGQAKKAGEWAIKKHADAFKKLA